MNGPGLVWRSTATRTLAGLLFLSIPIAGLFVPLPAMGQEGGESIATRLVYQDVESDERLAVPGVRIVVQQDGQDIAEGVSDDEGNVDIPVPGPGSYTVVLDAETIPEGVALRDPERSTLEIDVLANGTGRVIFALIDAEQEGSVGGGSGVTLRRVLQLSTEGLKLGLFLGMAAIGLSLIFGTTGLVNFAHGEMVTFGMLVAYFFNFYGFAGIFGFMKNWPPPFGGGINLILAALFAIAAGALLGWLFDRYIFAPLRRRGVSLIAAMVVTIGISIVMRYVFLFLFRGTPRFFRQYTAQSGIQLGPVDITPKDLVTGILSVVILVGVGLFLQNTKLGTAMRAVSDNRDLAESSGIDVTRVIRVVWIAGGALAALGGVFIGLSEQVSWNIGFRILLLIFAGVILGGLGTAYGALVGCLLVGFGIQVSTIWVPTELKNVGALVVLILVLLVRPQGIMGRRERIG